MYCVDVIIKNYDVIFFTGKELAGGVSGTQGEQIADIVKAIEGIVGDLKNIGETVSLRTDYNQKKSHSINLKPFAIWPDTKFSIIS